MTAADDDVIQAFKVFLDRVAATPDRRGRAALSPLGEAIAAHLGTDPSVLPVVSDVVADHRLVDADVALEQLTDGAPGSLIGVGGGQQRHHTPLSELIAGQFVVFTPGPVDYSSRPTGHTSTRQVVSFGIRLLHFDGEPLAVLQRAANPQSGRSTAELEVVGASSTTVTRFLERLHRLMVEVSVLRGQVLSFSGTPFEPSAGVTFLARPAVPAESVVLAEGILEAVTDHVVGIGEHRDVLLAAGQHLKRGVLLYGPPGTGKTLTVRHLMTRTPDVTTVLLTGTSIQFIGAATEIARTFPPSIVVLEDIDLVAMQRGASPQPLLFEVLDALDGLAGDADVAFVMTTNRVEVLERALAERPGRVDLAVEIPLPSQAERRRLFRRYAGDLPFTESALDAAADGADGVTGSFAKELVRRAVLLAAVERMPVADRHLAVALDALLSARESLTRRLLGSGGGDEHGDESTEDTLVGSTDGQERSFGWTAYAPLGASSSTAFASSLSITSDSVTEPTADRSDDSGTAADSAEVDADASVDADATADAVPPVASTRSAAPPALSDPHTATAADGTAISWRETGTGSPLLLISGQGVSSSSWKGVLADFATRHRVIVFDHRGTGASAAGEESGYTTRGFAQDAVAVLDAAGVDRAHVYGHSMGGRVAQWLALDAPDRVLSLVLGATTGGDAGGEPRSPAASADLASGKPHRLARLFFGSEKMHAEASAFFRAGTGHRARRLHFDASRGHDAWGVVAGIRAPTLVIHGSDDEVTPPGNGRRLAELIPDARLTLLDGARHGYFIEHPDATAVVLAFLADHDPADHDPAEHPAQHDSADPAPTDLHPDAAP